MEEKEADDEANKTSPLINSGDSSEYEYYEEVEDTSPSAFSSE